jgi:hypothetical protein
MSTFIEIPAGKKFKLILNGGFVIASEGFDEEVVAPLPIAVEEEVAEPPQDAAGIHFGEESQSEESEEDGWEWSDEVEKYDDGRYWEFPEGSQVTYTVEGGGICWNNREMFLGNRYESHPMLILGVSLSDIREEFIYNKTRVVDENCTSAKLEHWDVTQGMCIPPYSICTAQYFATRGFYAPTETKIPHKLDFSEYDPRICVDLKMVNEYSYDELRDFCIKFGIEQHRLRKYLAVYRRTIA